MLTGIFYTDRSAYAHNFSGDESASFLAKVQELKVETHLLQQNPSNKMIVAWHIDKISEFWNANDTKEMAERNQKLSAEIPNNLSSLATEAIQTNPNAAKIKQIVDSLDSSLAEATAARIDPAALNNATVKALAIANVLDETVEDYGIAVGAEERGHDTERDASTSSSNNKSTAVVIVDSGAYQTAQGLAAAAQNMFNDLKAKTLVNLTSIAVSKIDQGLTNLKQAIDNKASNDKIISIVEDTLQPNLMTGFNLHAAPEFSLPMLLTTPAAIAGIIIAARISALRRNI